MSNAIVRLEVTGGVALVTLDRPPVNALSAAVRRGILEQVNAAIADAKLQAIVLTCAGRFDVMVQLAAADPAALDHALGQIAALPGITQAETLVHLATRLDRTA